MEDRDGFAPRCREQDRRQRDPLHMGDLLVALFELFETHPSAQAGVPVSFAHALRGSVPQRISVAAPEAFI